MKLEHLEGWNPNLYYNDFMNFIILFRFHNRFDICKNRLEIIKKFNPDIKIYGLYGGEEESFNKALATLSSFFENIYSIKGKSSDWKWKNGDLAIREWFRDFGINLIFDSVVVLEWDLLQFDSIERIYSHINKDCVGLTGPILTKEVENRWKWLSEEPYKSEWGSLKKFVSKEYGYCGEYYATLGPGPILPNSFLKKYTSIEVPELCHDELRLPLIAKVLGFNICDTGFFRKWYDEDEPKFFNCWDVEISPETIKSELVKENGRRVFHPYRKLFDLNQL